MELRSCYFCGTGGDALDTHDVGADETVRVTLCPDCHDKLGRVLDAVGDDGADRGFEAGGEVTFDDESTVESGSGFSDADAEESSEVDGRNDESDDRPDVVVADDEPDDDPAASGSDESSGRLGVGDSDGGGDIDTYRKALRMLRNREFPMERSEVVDLLSTAYDLDRDECAEVLDFAVDRGLLAEDGSTLRRP